MEDTALAPVVQLSIMRSGLGLIATPSSWIEPLDVYDSWQRAASLPQSTRKMRNYHLRKFATVIGKDPFTVSLDDLVGYLSSNPNWHANTKAAYRTTLRSFYKWAAISERIGRNPAEFMPVVKVPKGRPRPASDPVIDAAIAAAPIREALMIMLASYAGLRCCEIAAVHSANLVVRGEGDTLRAVLTVVGKGSKTRVLPIKRPELIHAIIDAQGYLFTGHIEGHVSAAYVSRLVSRALGPTATAHQLRHRFATTALRGTKDLRALQEALGHASLATTQIYTDVLEDDLWALVEAAA